MLTASGGGATDERCENALGRKQARGEIADRHAESDRRTIHFTRHAHQAAFGLRDGVVAGTGLEGTGLSVTRDRGVDQTWVTFRQRGVVETEAVQRARFEIFDKNVGAFDQRIEYAPARPAA